MNTPRISFSLSFFKQLKETTESFRIFVISSVITVYGLMLYELFPEFLFNPNYSLYYFVIPMGILGFSGIGLPRLMPIILEKIFKKPAASKPPQSKEDADSDDILDQLVTEGSTQQLVQQDSTGVMSDDSQSPSAEALPGSGPDA